jgi:hypothetical protein
MDRWMHEKKEGKKEGRREGGWSCHPWQALALTEHVGIFPSVHVCQTLGNIRTPTSHKGLGISNSRVTVLLLCAES